MRKYNLRFKKFLIPLLIFISVIFILPTKALGEINFPKATKLKYVNDYVGILDKKTKDYIVSVGLELERKTGVQSVVVIIDSLEGYDIRDYGNKLFRNWEIGQKDKNNGLLILVSIKERKRAVEVGAGLEGVIPDTLSNRIMEGDFVPNFKEKKYDKGIRGTYTAFADVISKEYNVTLDKNDKVHYKNHKNHRGINPIYIFIVIALVILDIILNRGRVISSILDVLIWGLLFNGGSKDRRDDDDDDHFGGFGGFGGGSSNDDFGGFGGGTSNGGGSSGDW